MPTPNAAGQNLPEVTPENAAEGQPTYDFRVIGKSGLRRHSGYVSEELHPRLAGSKAARIFREMSDNDSTIGAVLFVVEALLRQVNFRVDPVNDSPEALACAEFVNECLTDMSHTWDDFLSEILTMLPFGWAYFETVYKMRQGQTGATKSRFSDGRIGWRKFSLRAQDTLDRWEFDEDGGLRGMWQSPPPDYRRVFIPIEKAVLFRPKAPKNNPEGRSFLRNAYRSWFLLKRLQEIEVIGIERDLTGLPVLEVPPAMMLPNAPPALATLRATLETMIQQIRRDEREGVIVPAESYTDDAGDTVVTGYKFRLLNSGGTRAVPVAPSIDRYQRDIARTMLAEFIFLGDGSAGSFALADSKTRTFASGLGSFLDSICSTFQTYAIVPLLQLNAFPESHWPTFVHGDIETPDLEALANFVATLVGAGALASDEKLERHLRQTANLPQRDLAEEEPRNAAPAEPSTTPSISDALRGLIPKPATPAAPAAPPASSPSPAA